MPESNLDIKRILTMVYGSDEKRTAEGYEKRIPRKSVTTHGPEKKFVSLDIPTDDPELDEIFTKVILNKDERYFADELDVFYFLNNIVDMVCREAKTRNLKTASVEEKRLIKLKLERSQKILIVLKKNTEGKEKKLDGGVTFPGLIKQQIDLVSEQLEKY